MRSNDFADDQHISVHAHGRLIPLPLDTHTSAAYDMYSTFFSSFPDPVSIAAYPYSLSLGSPMDMSLQQTLMQLDVPDTHVRNDLSESYAPVVNVLQQIPHQYPPSVQHQSPQPRPSNLSSLQSNGHAHTMLPPVIQPNPNDPSMQFDSETRTFNQRITNTGISQADPYAAKFLEAQLGPEKFSIFSARLSERRVGGQTPKSKLGNKPTSPSPYSDSKAAGATAIDFLVKVEVVKEILRTYVPHPYNPLKSLTHLFEGCPKGSVTLTRSTVLILSGWSNTQFSYWARRAEAISVLGQYDDRLLSVGTALKRRLRGELATHSTAAAAGTDPPLDAQSITGKGLDVIIDDVKKRTGVSQFLRGKHSSLDPFGSACMDGEFGVGIDVGAGGEGMEPGVKTVVFSATFQAVAYEHSPPLPAHPPSGAVQQRRGKGKRGRGKGVGKVAEERGWNATGGGSSEGEAQQIAFVMSGKHVFSAERPTSSAPSTSPPSCSPFLANDRERRSVGSTCIDHHDQGVQVPVSDSRSELEQESLRKRKMVSKGVVGGKRLRASGM